MMFTGKNLKAELVLLKDTVGEGNLKVTRTVCPKTFLEKMNCYFTMPNCTQNGTHRCTVHRERRPLFI